MSKIRIEAFVSVPPCSGGVAVKRLLKRADLGQDHGPYPLPVGYIGERTRGAAQCLALLAQLESLSPPPPTQTELCQTQLALRNQRLIAGFLRQLDRAMKQIHALSSMPRHETQLSQPTLAPGNARMVRCAILESQSLLGILSSLPQVSL